MSTTPFEDHEQADLWKVGACHYTSCRTNGNRAGSRGLTAANCPFMILFDRSLPLPPLLFPSIPASRLHPEGQQEFDRFCAQVWKDKHNTFEVEFRRNTERMQKGLPNGFHIFAWQQGMAPQMLQQLLPATKPSSTLQPRLETRQQSQQQSQQQIQQLPQLLQTQMQQQFRQQCHLQRSASQLCASNCPSFQTVPHQGDVSMELQARLSLPMKGSEMQGNEQQPSRLHCQLQAMSSASSQTSLPICPANPSETPGLALSASDVFRTSPFVAEPHYGPPRDVTNDNKTGFSSVNRPFSPTWATTRTPGTSLVPDRLRVAQDQEQLLSVTAQLRGVAAEAFQSPTNLGAMNARFNSAVSRSFPLSPIATARYCRQVQFPRVASPTSVFSPTPHEPSASLQRSPETFSATSDSTNLFDNSGRATAAVVVPAVTQRGIVSPLGSSCRPFPSVSNGNAQQATQSRFSAGQTGGFGNQLFCGTHPNLAPGHAEWSQYPVIQGRGPEVMANTRDLMLSGASNRARSAAPGTSSQTVL